MKTKLKRYPKKVIIAYYKKLLKERRTKKPGQESLMDWVDSGSYTFSKTSNN